MKLNRRKRCAICGAFPKSKPISTEEIGCELCGSTWRAQEICSAVLVGLGYPDQINIRDINPDLSRVGLGISDDWRLASIFSPLFAYTNSFLHQFPLVDICSPPPEVLGKFEFISCSDVLEHTPPPRNAALVGLFQMLKPAGFAVISVPLRRGFEFAEFYPGLTKWRTENDSIHWVDENGLESIDSQPEFHGGEGLTLAFRQWTEEKLIEELKAVGFSEIISRPIPPFFGLEQTICVVIAHK